MAGNLPLRMFLLRAGKLSAVKGGFKDASYDGYHRYFSIIEYIKLESDRRYGIILEHSITYFIN